MVGPATRELQRIVAAREKRKQEARSSGPQKAAGVGDSKVTITNTRTGITTTTVYSSSGRRKSRRSRRATPTELAPKQLGPTKPTVQISQITKKMPTARDRALKQQRLAFISGAFTQKQQDRLFDKFNSETQAELFKIEKRKDLNRIQKEQFKRRLLGIGQEPTILVKAKLLNKLNEAALAGVTNKDKQLINMELTGQTMTRLQNQNLAIAKRNFVNQANDYSQNQTVVGLKALGLKFLNKKDLTELARYISTQVADGIVGAYDFLSNNKSPIPEPIKVVFRYQAEQARVTRNFIKSGNKPAKTFVEAFSLPDQKRILSKATREKNLSPEAKKFLSNVALFYVGGKTLLSGYNVLAKKFGERVASGLLTTIMSGVVANDVIRAIKDPSVENRSVLLGNIILSGTAEKIITKARSLSPTTIKGVKILEGTASERGAGQALKQLEGKKINLYSATESELKDLFKSSPINKQELSKLIKDMKQNPEVYITENFKIKPLKTIATTQPKRVILDTIKGTNAALSGSGSLKVQLQNFRKVGDLDILSTNPLKTAKQIINNLNNKTFVGKLIKNRYTIVKKPNAYTIKDRLLNRDIADVVSFKSTEKTLGRKLNKNDFVTVDGVKVLKAELQLGVKAKISQTPEFKSRQQKELKDINLIVGKKTSNTKAKEIDKLMTQNGLLKVEAKLSGAGTARRYQWAEQYLGNLNLPFRRNKKLESKINSRLKKEWGFTNKQISDNINLYAPTDFYFAPNQVYSHYLNGNAKGNILFVKNVKISSYPKSIQDRLKKNFDGLLNAKERARLGNDMRLWRLKNPDKVFVGQKALQDGFGEFEVLAPEFTKFFPRKTLLRREIYIPSLNKFVRATEITLGKPNNAIIKSIVKSFKSKLKKGYGLEQMKKDIAAWVKKNKSKFNKKNITSKIKNTISEKNQLKLEKDFLKNERKKLAEFEKKVKSNKKLSKSQKEELLERIKNQRKRITPSRATPKAVLTIRKGYISLNNRYSSLTRTPTRRTPTRAPTRTPTRRTPTRRTRTRAPTRAPTRTPTRRTPTRAPTRTPTRRTPARAPTPTEKPPRLVIPRIDWDFKKKDNTVYTFDIVFRERRAVSKNFNKKSNPVVTKTKKVSTTRNRALNMASQLADYKTIRSIDVKVRGKTNKKLKEVSLTNRVNKFTPRRTTNALKFVEKAKFAIDSRPEKRELKQRARTKKKKLIKKSKR